MPNSIRDGDFKKKFEPTYLEEKKKIKNSDYFSQMLTNDIFNLSQSEQLSVNIKVGLVFFCVSSVLKMPFTLLSI